MLFTINPHLLPQLPPMPVKQGRTNYSAPAFEAKQRKLRERSYARRALRANMLLWRFVLRILKAVLSSLWAKVPTAPQPEPADHEWPAGEYVSLAQRWAGKPI